MVGDNTGVGVAVSVGTGVWLDEGVAVILVDGVSDGVWVGSRTGTCVRVGSGGLFRVAVTETAVGGSDASPNKPVILSREGNFITYEALTTTAIKIKNTENTHGLTNGRVLERLWFLLPDLPPIFELTGKAGSSISGSGACGGLESPLASFIFSPSKVGGGSIVKSSGVFLRVVDLDSKQLLFEFLHALITILRADVHGSFNRHNHSALGFGISL